MNAQDNYKYFLNNYVSPAMRDRKFKGSAGKYAMVHPGAFVQIGFQKSKWSTQDEIEFTINISVIDKEVWNKAILKYPWLGVAPSASSAEYPFDMWHTRLGILSSYKADHWWKISTKSNLESIFKDIIDRFDNDALPAIRDQLIKINS